MCCHVLNKLDSSALGPLVASSLHSERYIPRPSKSRTFHGLQIYLLNYYIVHSSHTLQSSLILPSPGQQMAAFFANSKKEHCLQQLKKTYNRLQSLAQARPTMLSSHKANQVNHTSVQACRCVGDHVASLIWKSKQSGSKLCKLIIKCPLNTLFTAT